VLPAGFGSDMELRRAKTIADAIKARSLLAADSDSVEVAGHCATDGQVVHRVLFGRIGQKGPSSSPRRLCVGRKVCLAHSFKSKHPASQAHLSSGAIDYGIKQLAPQP
jgi:hypothetical protein